MGDVFKFLNLPRDPGAKFEAEFRRSKFIEIYARQLGGAPGQKHEQQHRHEDAQRNRHRDRFHQSQRRDSR